MRRTQALSGDGGCSQRTGGLSCWKRERWAAAASVDRHEFHDINRQAETAQDLLRYKAIAKDELTELFMDTVLFMDMSIYWHDYSWACLNVF
jgi:hypothetical protein